MQRESRRLWPATRTPFAVIAVGVAVVAWIFTWRRLFLGMDLQDESFYILIPWRWALGDKPFVDEVNLAQIGAFLEYPFIKAFAIVRGGDVTGLVLYGRHLYLVLMSVVAVAVFVALRRLIRWELAAPAAAVYISYVFWETPQLSYNTMGGAFLTLGAAFGVPLVTARGGRGWALASGVSYGLAVIAYPTLVFVVPVVAVFLALGLGAWPARIAGLGSAEASTQPATVARPSGRRAWSALLVWAVGVVLVLAPFAVYLLSVETTALQRSLDFSMDVARGLNQLGGPPKALEVVRGFWRFIWTAPYLVVAALVVFVVFLRRPRVGRMLLALLPLALWRAGQHAMLDAAGFVIIYALLVPYLYLFVPRRRREVRARILCWVWAPALVAGAMTAFTSASAYIKGPVGLLPAVLVGGLFLGWALEPERGAQSPDAPRSAWLALAALVAVVGVTLVFQFQFQQRELSYTDLTSRFRSGPWFGIAVTPERRLLVESVERDLRAFSRPGDALLIQWQAPGYYLLWNGDIASNTAWLSPGDDDRLPRSTVDHYSRHGIVPTLVLRFMSTEGRSKSELRAATGGLKYPAVVVRGRYLLARKPPEETVDDVIARLSAP